MSDYRHGRSKAIRSVVISAVLIWLTACTTQSALLPYHAPPETFYLAEVIGFPYGQATREAILQSSETYQLLLTTGVKDEDIRDGSIERGRVYCCGGPDEGGGITLFFVPSDLQIALGDFVEVRAGQKPETGSAGKANVATRVILRENAKSTEANCRWDPPDPRLWQRVIYCDWMLGQGWLQGRGVGSKPWYGPGTGESPGTADQPRREL